MREFTKGLSIMGGTLLAPPLIVCLAVTFDTDPMKVVFGLVWGFCLLSVGIFLYFLPIMLMANCDRGRIKLVFLLNLILGWTLIGWLVCLAIALASPNVTQRA